MKSLPTAACLESQIVKDIAHRLRARPVGGKSLDQMREVVRGLLEKPGRQMTNQCQGVRRRSSKGGSRTQRGPGGVSLGVGFRQIDFGLDGDGPTWTIGLSDTCLGGPSFEGAEHLESACRPKR